MNVFFLDVDPVRAAQSLCDKHVPKMLLESVQILSTVSHLRGVKAPYRWTHQHHPCVLWTNERRANYEWLAQHTDAIDDEYRLRFQRHHRSFDVFRWLLRHGARPSSGGTLTPPAQAMPDQYRRSATVRGAVRAYRAYYIGEKGRFAAWKRGREAPDWW